MTPTAIPLPMASASTRTLSAMAVGGRSGSSTNQRKEASTVWSRLSVSVTETENTPAVVVVPLISPVAGLMSRPVGRSVADHVIERATGCDPVACSDTESPTSER